MAIIGFRQRIRIPESMSQQVLDDANELRSRRNRIPETARQDVLDAAAELQVRRSQVADAVARGETDQGEIVARGYEGIGVWMFEPTYAASELLSVRPAATVEQMQLSVPHNRAAIAGGLQMTSIFHYDALDPDVRLFLSGETAGTYAFGVAPVQLKFFDDCLVLQGPFVDGEITVMAVTSPECRAAARAYWDAVVASSFPAAEAGQGLDDLTERQRQILALLATDTKDEAIAAALGVSVRTVRTDVAGILKTLGVRSRFAAGLQVRRRVVEEQAQQP